MGITVLGAVFVDIKGYPLTQYIPGGRNVGRVVQVHGGVSRNVAEDIANVHLRPTFISVVDYSGTGKDVIERLKRHEVNTDYIGFSPDGLGTWLAVFDNNGDVTASISKRPDLSEISRILAESGDEIFEASDSIVVEIDMEEKLLRQVFELAKKHKKEVYAVVSNMSLAMERRGMLTKTGCIVCNQQEAGLLFSEDYDDMSPQQLAAVIHERAEQAKIRRMVVTMGGKGAVYSERDGSFGTIAPKKVDVIDTTGAGDAFFAGCAIGLTYGKTLAESCEIGTVLASSVIATKESVCPSFQPEEFGLPNV